MNKVIFVLLFLITTSVSADSKKREPQGLQERIRSEFGLDRFEITCEFYISGDNVKPRHSAMYEAIPKELCILKAKQFLRMSPKVYKEVLIKHAGIQNEMILQRKPRK